MEIRKYRLGEERAIWNIYYNTIHHVNTAHYSRDQIEAWAPVNLDESTWSGKIREIDPYIAVLNGIIVGYTSLQENGYIDHFFCHHEHLRKGVGSALFSFLEKEACQKNVSQLSADVSITARPFFESKGFEIVKEQRVSLRGQEFTNYRMVREYAQN